MNRTLIVNADDCNLTRGVTRAIIECHDFGIVTSTTFLINLPIFDQEIKSLKRRGRLGVGLHLNVTLGVPVARPSQVSTLVNHEGSFLRELSNVRRDKSQVAVEYENQIQLFKKVFGRLPTHLDTHHQVHHQKAFFEILQSIAHKYRLPIRRPQLSAPGSKSIALQDSAALVKKSVRTTDYLWGSLDPKKYWRRVDLERLIKNMLPGVHEVMCHPGSNDADLKKISSFQKGRTTEWRLFRCRGLKYFVRQNCIKRAHFGVCYN